MRFMTLEPEVMISFTYTQPAQAVPVTFTTSYTGITEYILQIFDR